MNREPDPFELSSLPPLVPPGDGWSGIAADIQRQRRRRQAAIGLGAAAVLALAVGMVFQLPRFTPDAGQPAVTSAGAVDPASRQSVTAEENLEALIGLSRQLERNVRLVRSEIDTMPAQSVVYQVELEDLVAQVDDALSLDPDSRDLWSQRVNLLLDLEQLYQRELRRDYSNMASL